MISGCNKALKALWIREIMTSFKGYANDVENERVNVEWMRSLLKTDLNRFLGYENQMFKAWNTFSKNEQFDSTFNIIRIPLNDVMIEGFIRNLKDVHLKDVPLLASFTFGEKLKPFDHWKEDAMMKFNLNGPLSKLL